MNREENKYCRLLVALCTICYFVSYITRINYGAVLIEMEKAEGISKTAASMALTGSFITYGAGQLVSGWLGDRMKPRRLILAGILVSAAMNVLVPVSAKPGLMLVFWCINGFAQALIWPPMVRILASYLDDEQYKKGCVRVNWGSSAGTIFVYLAAPFCIMWKGWRSVFFLCAGVAFCFAFLWIRGVTMIETRLEAQMGKQEQEVRGDGRRMQRKEQRSLLSGKLRLLLPVIMFAIVMQGSLRDGITTWMPGYLAETFRLDSSLSILSGVTLPIFSIICLEITSVLNRKLIKNELLCAGTVFLTGFLGALLLSLIPAFCVQISVFLSALITGCMYGVNVILVSMIPPYFKKSGNVSTVSGLLNSCTYVGSALSGFGIAWAVQHKGWSFAIWLWAAAAFTGTALCLCSGKLWNQYRESSGI